MSNFIEQAIQKAIEGGWEAETWKQLRTRMVNPKEDIKVHVENFEGKMFAYIGAGNWNCADIFLSPLFWQSLGKSLGWPPATTFTLEDIECNDFQVSFETCVYQQHRFIEHLNHKKSAESFFESLINVKG